MVEWKLEQKLTCTSTYESFTSSLNSFFLVLVLFSESKLKIKVSFNICVINFHVKPLTPDLTQHFKYSNNKCKTNHSDLLYLLVCPATRDTTVF